MPIDPGAPPSPAWLAVLSDKELDRARRYRRAADAHRFIAGRAMLRSLLGAQIGIRPGEIHLVQAPDGRVALANHPGPAPSFSVSHGGALVAVALGRGAVGVDIEPIPADVPPTSFIYRTCTRRESELLKGLAADRRCQQFARFWARKEALCKMGGAAGMAYAGTIEVLGKGNGRVGSGSTWRLWDLALAEFDAYAIALATRGPARVRTVLVDPGY